jgi:hypothetical protein
MSPAGELVEETGIGFNQKYSDSRICEVLIGLGLLVKRLIPYTIMLLLHMCATLFPVFILKHLF